MPSGANPLLVIAESLPAHLDELREERQKLVARLIAVNAELASGETHLAVSAPESVPRKPVAPEAEERKK